MSLPRYDNYKDSGVEWIGEIPEGWEVKRLKRLAKILNGQDHKSVWDIDGEYPILGSGGIFGYANQCLHNGPSVLLGRKGTIDKPQYVKNAFWSVDTAYFTEIYPENCPKFFYYLCTTINFDLHKYGSAVPSMTQEVLNQVPFSVPPLPEQTAIASFLDRKTAEIDQLIANKEKLIALYEEEKTAIINRAVTRGLDPAVKTRPSGVDWLGDIPEHWEVKRLKYVAKINPTKDASINKNSDDLIVFLPMEKVQEDGSIDCGLKKPISELWSGFTFFRRNDVIIAKITPCFENGKGALLSTLDTEIGFGSTEFHVLRASKSILPKLMYFITKSERFMKVGEAFMTGSAGQKRVPTDFVAEFDIALPPLPEQTAIVTQIETECTRLDTIIDKFKKQIELFKEYRTTLISEVVTGKIDVRGEVEV